VPPHDVLSIACADSGAFRLIMNASMNACAVGTQGRYVVTLQRNALTPVRRGDTL